MKTPQRNFVVEFKSVRRQPKVGNSSIWGDTDLKSLVREVEGDAPHLFNLQQASPIHGNNDDTPSNNVSAGAPAEDSARLAARQPAESLPNEVQSRELDQPSAKTSIVESPEQQRSDPTSSEASNDPLQGHAEHAGVNIDVLANEEREVQFDTVSNEISTDELIALEAENQRLKWLLAEKLHAQNLQLKRMLVRFDLQ
jgi:hypothetical protein